MVGPLERSAGKSQNEEFYNVRGNGSLTRYGLRPGPTVAQNAIECKTQDGAQGNGEEWLMSTEKSIIEAALRIRHPVTRRVFMQLAAQAGVAIPAASTLSLQSGSVL